ncbi:fibronectin type III domain-containing protein [Candidatus Nomurabacteria bacterium]|jgi:hypothetical protein|nr:MAG: fibronectin type III domain-containing protein [Candidatus Nomurabacteria bacterium]
MNFSNPNYNAAKIVLLLAVIIGGGYFILTHSNQNFTGVARVIDADPSPVSDTPVRQRPTPVDETTTGPGPKQQSTFSTVVNSIVDFGGSIKSALTPNANQNNINDKTSNVVATVTTNTATITGLSAGTYIFAVSATDTSGNTSEQSDPITVVISDIVVPDTTDPVISSIAVDPGETSATITWNTNENASSIVEYGRTISYGTTTEEDVLPMVTQHSVTITGLTQNTAYHFDVKSKDASGNTGTSSDNTFTTDAAVVIPPVTPTITSSNPISGSNNTSPKLLGSADSGTTVALYTTAGCTGSAVTSGTAAAFASPGLTVSVADNSTTTFKATATDSSGNVSGCSAGFSYTEVTPDTTDPVISSIGVTSTQTTATITWSTNEASSSSVDYGTTTSYTNSTSETNISPKVTNHTVTITGLAANTLYHFSVKSKDAAGNIGASSDNFFTTLAIVLPVTPTITSANPISGSNNNSPKLKGTAPSGTTVKIYADSACAESVVISGTSNKFASPGLTVSVADNSTTTFKATATDSSGNVSGCSAGFSYTEVTPDTPDITAPVISSITISPTDTTAVATWTTDELASTLVNYGTTTSYGLTTGTSDTLPRVTSHSVTLQSLTPGTLYYVSLISTDASGNIATSSDQTFTTGNTVTYQCGDDVDNDGDSIIDADDPGCTDSNDDNEADEEVIVEETPAPPAGSGGNYISYSCGDGQDNDSDGKMDYPSDPGCTSTLDDNEIDPSDFALGCEVAGTPVLLVKIGLKGEDAKVVQKAVNQLDAATPELVTDGIIGPKSLSGIKTAQTILGTKVDGLWGKITQGLYTTWTQETCPKL